ncbi:MAG: hypothetical protein JJ920_13150 [Roseitalea sp.]|jgi:hypothetical protein|nr:hypothetical protein [Roseitalea sp.]MBO6743853.1 hypothetical protein [Roseitalea sp.]
MIVMLALVVAMAVPGTTLDGAPGYDTAAADHTQVAETIMVDMLADCCAVEDGKMHHAMGGCAMDCSNAVPTIGMSLGETDSNLTIARSAAVPGGVAATQFRPPIAA